MASPYAYQGLGCIGLRKLLYSTLIALFTYKAIKELGIDPLWSIIYVLVGLEYLFELRSDNRG